jgi:hypothetical protein
VGKKQQSSTIENRVYLFADLASAFLEDNGETLVGTDAQRDKAMRALGDLAHAACVVADHAGVDGRRVGDMVARGHRHGATAAKISAKKPAAKKGATKKSAKKKKKGATKKKR